MSVTENKPQAVTDIPMWRGMEDIRLAFFLAVNDLRFRYSRSFIGPMWIALQMAIFVVILGVVLSEVHGVPIRDFAPFFAVSLMFWTLLNSSINEGMEALQAGAELIKDRGISPIVPVLQAVFRNILVAAHCAVVPAAALLLFGATSLRGLMMAVPGIILFVAVATCLTITVASLGCRYRDLKRIVESAMMMTFLATPILWQPGILRGRGSYVLDFNPVAHLFAVWREPMLEGRWPIVSFAVVGALLGLSFLAARRAFYTLRRVVFWL
jgi:lipopolysaccharide transport system permease protein